ncbi:MAG TPA: hypothetical protein PK677_15200 [Acidiphilium sp.]|uniref:hypothetical protein n=1 Tax=Acidiphilium sp. 37-64-53 TaxID=1970299 RepID=UPI00257A8004|nr:hypothetical protein [Acidiphilium sp. 37-64-53]HQT89865.1 hypothetical protein [Acidiphilium sp.]
MDDLSSFAIGDDQSLFPDGVRISDAMQFLETRNSQFNPTRDLRRITLDLLLDAVSATSRTDYPTEASLWVEEGARRAITLLQLMLLKGQRVEMPICAGQQVKDEHQLALRLAGLYRAIYMFDWHTINWASDSLVAISSTLVALFSPVPSPVTLNVSVQSLSVDYWSARALISIVSELVVGSLISSFQKSRGGEITITLEQTSPSTAKLVVRDNIASVNSKFVSSGHRLIGRLSRILDAELHYHSPGSDGYRFDLSFKTDHGTSPIQKSNGRRRNIQHVRV